MFEFNSTMVFNISKWLVFSSNKVCKVLKQNRNAQKQNHKVNHVIQILMKMIQSSNMSFKF